MKGSISVSHRNVSQVSVAVSIDKSRKVSEVKIRRVRRRGERGGGGDTVDAVGARPPYRPRVSSPLPQVASGSVTGPEMNVGTYWGTSLTRKRTPLGPCRRPVPRVLGGS